MRDRIRLRLHSLRQHGVDVEIKLDVLFEYFQVLCDDFLLFRYGSLDGIHQLTNRSLDQDILHIDLLIA